MDNLVDSFNSSDHLSLPFDYIGLHFVPGLVDFVSIPADGAAKTLKIVFPYLYTGQVK